MPASQHVTLQSLSDFCQGLKERVDHFNKYPSPASSVFRYLVGPWLSKELLPHPMGWNRCRFLTGYQQFGESFINQILIPLAGDQLLQQEHLDSSSTSILGRLQKYRIPEMRSLLRGLELRLATLQIFHERDRVANELAIRLQRLIEAYIRFFSTRTWTLASAYKTSERTSAWTGIHRLDPEFAERIAQVVKDGEWSFRDPAVAFVTDTFCELLGQSPSYRSFSSEDQRGHCWSPGETWALMILHLPGTKDIHAKKMGLIFRLMIEAIRHDQSDYAREGTSSAVYPHPHLGVHYPILSSFQTSIRNAWLSTVGPRSKEGAPTDCDYRWSLIAIDPTDSIPQGIEVESIDRRIEKFAKIPQGALWEEQSREGSRHRCLWSPLAGQSATMAFALGLKSAIEREILLRDVAATGQLHLPDDDCNKLTSDPSTGKLILGLPQKLLAAQQANITRLIVSDRQQSELPLPDSAWSRCSTLSSAYREATELERWMSMYCNYFANRWETIANASKDKEPDTVASSPSRGSRSKNASIDLAVKAADELRLDWYVDPEYAWQEDLASEAKAEKKQLPDALRDWLSDSAKHLLVIDEAGAGKTISSYRIQHLLSDRIARKTIFGEDIPSHLVIHWPGQLPKADKPSEPNLYDLLLADPTLSHIERQSNQSLPREEWRQRREKVLAYAIDNRRLIVIVDAYDELPETAQQLLQKIIRDDAREIRFVITSRDYAVKEAVSLNQLFDPDKFRYLEVKPFSEALQNEFMEKAIGSKPWRHALDGSPEDWDPLLGLPYTLAELARYFQDFGVPAIESTVSGSAGHQWLSPSDLFVDFARRMIERELDKQKNSRAIRKLKKKLGEGDYSVEEQCDVIERVLGSIAIEMAVRELWRNVGTTEEVKSIWVAAEHRFKSRQGESKSDILWRWGREFAKDFQLNKGSTQGDLKSRWLSFRNRRVQEMWAARYLTRYASQEDLTGATETSGNDLNKARGTPWFRKLWDFVSRRSSSMDRPQPKGICQFVGHEGWGNLWKCAAQMPLKTDLRRRHSPVSNYQEVMSLVFNLPANPAYRRPTEAMWFCDSMLDRQAKLGVAEASQITVALRKVLTDRFDQLRISGTAKQKKIVAELLDPSTYVLLCSEDKSLRLPGDTGSFTMGPDPYFGDCVQVTLTPFGICKYLLSEEQYWLFDPALPASEEYRMPETKISWCDCYYFTVFLSNARVRLPDGREYRFRIPTEAQGEYAARAGSKRDYFLSDDGQEVTEETLTHYAVYGAISPLAVDTASKHPNRWGIMHPVGNVWQWRWDYDGRYKDVYPDGKATDPTGPQTGSFRVVRGGSWSRGAADCRSANRLWLVPSGRRYSNYGFRVALSPIGIPRPPEASSERPGNQPGASGT